MHASLHARLPRLERSGGFFGGLIDGLTDWLINWLIDWLIKERFATEL